PARFLASSVSPFAPESREAFMHESTSERASSSVRDRNTAMSTIVHQEARITKDNGGCRWFSVGGEVSSDAASEPGRFVVTHRHLHHRVPTPVMEPRQVRRVTGSHDAQATEGEGVGGAVHAVVADEGIDGHDGVPLAPLESVGGPDHDIGAPH